MKESSDHINGSSSIFPVLTSDFLKCRMTCVQKKMNFHNDHIGENDFQSLKTGYLVFQSSKIID